MNILLFSMPFGALDRPALGLSLLKPRAEADGHACTIAYPVFGFADEIGAEAYTWLTNGLPHVAFVAEWCFTEALYGPMPDLERHYVNSVLLEQWGMTIDQVKRVLAVRAAATRFIDELTQTYDWSRYDVVGFTSTFEQNIASLALARRVKAAHARPRIAFGGANWEGDMGAELMRRFPFVDLAFSGEADESFPDTLKALQSSKRPISVTGVTTRDDLNTAVAPKSRPVETLDSLPIPEFSEFFAARAASDSGPSVTPTLLAETSRGCWWGAKSHCTFCGLNGGTMRFRSKSPERARDEILGLASRWQIPSVQIVDNILDMSYFANLLPDLAARHAPVALFYEIKANLTRDQIAIMAAAGVTHVQPGIESLSDNVLKLMRKGTTGLRNLQTLKWCKEAGIHVDWNVLHGFPRETAADYDEMLAMLPAVRHFDPPSGYGPVRLDRFSPYFNEPATFGLRDLRPVSAYGHLYPFGPESLSRIAYYFDYDYDDDVDPKTAAAAVVDYVREWTARPETGTLRASETPDGLLIADTRSNAVIDRLRLRGAQRALYLYCDRVRSLDGILAFAREVEPGIAIDESEIRAFLKELVAKRLMATAGACYLSLALSEAPRAAAALLMAAE